MMRIIKIWWKTNFLFLKMFSEIDMVTELNMAGMTI